MIRSGPLTGIRLGWKRGRMGVTVTFCNETKHERRENKRDDPFFR
jgi:hypothetical protein